MLSEATEGGFGLRNTAELSPLPQIPRRMRLRQLRKNLGRTQVDVAAKAGMSQGDLSRLERRNDYLLSTLERYATALGGTLEIAVIRGAQRYPLEFSKEPNEKHDPPSKRP